MRKDELIDLELAAAGDTDAIMRIERRRIIRKMVAEDRCQGLKEATPTWADMQAIKTIYEQARQITRETGVKHEVDHILPIRGKRLCGLHVPHNLRIITKSENARKRCKHDDRDVVGFLASRGYEVIYGVRKLNQQVRAGRAVIAFTGEGGCFQIQSYHGELVMDAIACGEQEASVLIGKKRY